jgi:dipeptidase E
MMIAFLTSSPCIYGAPRAILNPENSFIDNLFSCLPPNPRCLFICSAPDDPGFTDRVSREMAEAFQEAGMEFSRLYKLDRRNQKDAQLLIWKSDFIILSGGHVPTQNKFFQEIGLRDMLENYQGVILGISAGTMNAAGRVYAQPEEAGESVPEFKRFLSGLGITHVNVLPHYQQVKDYLLDGRRLYEDITFADSIGERFFVFVDGTYLLIEDGQTTLYGEAYCLQDGQMEQISKLGDVVIIEE